MEYSRWNRTTTSFPTMMSERAREYQEFDTYWTSCRAGKVPDRMELSTNPTRIIPARSGPNLPWHLPRRTKSALAVDETDRRKCISGGRSRPTKVHFWWTKVYLWWTKVYLWWTKLIDELEDDKWRAHSYLRVHNVHSTWLGFRGKSLWN